tara:strand:- start:77 stop:781 length:705 start_codon:yes stop_codon:yes gene_type:complete
MSAIKELIALQKIDLQLQDIESLLGDLPKKVEALVNEEKELTDNVENAKARLKELDLELNKCDSSIEETKVKIDKQKDQLFLVTNNKQYDALQLEIDHLKKEMDDLETKSLEFSEEKENLEEETKSNEENLDSLSTDLVLRREKLEVLMKESSEEKARLEKDRQSQVGNIDVNVLAKYDTVYEARKGLCVVPVEGSACGGCGGFVPPQIISEVRAGKGLHNCESCSRFLYYDSQ